MALPTCRIDVLDDPVTKWVLCTARLDPLLPLAETQGPPEAFLTDGWFQQLPAERRHKMSAGLESLLRRQGHVGSNRNWIRVSWTCPECLAHTQPRTTSPAGAECALCHAGIGPREPHMHCAACGTKNCWEVCVLWTTWSFYDQGIWTRSVVQGHSDDEA